MHTRIHSSFVIIQAVFWYVLSISPFPHGPNMAAKVQLNPASRNRLMPRHSAYFEGDTLFERIARCVCAAGCLPRKELYESWEMARRIRRRFRGGRIVDWACGHGLLGAILLLLDDGSPEVIAFDIRMPASAEKLQAELVSAWPRLAGRWHFTTQQPELLATDLLVSCHACGALTDEVLQAASKVRARVAVMPCCHRHEALEREEWLGWLDPSLAMDIHRAEKLRTSNYEVWTTAIPAKISPKNRLLLGAPRAR